MKMDWRQWSLAIKLALGFYKNGVQTIEQVKASTAYNSYNRDSRKYQAFYVMSGLLLCIAQTVKDI